jgi:hypothetical protein
VANSAGLRRVALYDGATELAEVAGGATLTFSTRPREVNDRLFG